MQTTIMQCDNWYARGTQCSGNNEEGAINSVSSTEKNFTEKLIVELVLQDGRIFQVEELR